MTEFRVPLGEIRFALDVLSEMQPQGTASVASEYDDVLEAAAKFAEQVYAPINATGDRNGCKFEAGRVSTPDGFKAAYSAYAKAGWGAIATSTDVGGRRMPFRIAIAVSEMLNAANISLAMGSMPTPGAIELLNRFGTEAQKQYYLPRIISGEWTVTMAMTEPQAGSDLGAIKTRARSDDGAIAIKGLKSLITWGEHDLTEDTLHLVLARSPDGPQGVKGLSLYLVPKRLRDGSRNDVSCIGIERKMGLRGSPTASLSFGENGGAWAELLGQENAGLGQMFVLLNQARLRVAAFALGSAERALQAATQYARSRVQGRDENGAPTAIANHPDVQRMLTSMEARTQAIRLMLLYAASLVDRADEANGPQDNQANVRLEILTPITKAWCTEMAFDVASTGVQIFGGIGYSEECEASQYFREARVHMIYEGTTGIQASDLIFRKIIRDGGVGAKHLFEELSGSIRTTSSASVALSPICDDLAEAVDRLIELTSTIVGGNKQHKKMLQANGAHFLMFAGGVIAGWLSLLAAAKAESSRDIEDSSAKSRNLRLLVDQYIKPAATLAKASLSFEQMKSARGEIWAQ